MENQNNNQAVLAALGYPALPQTIVPVTKVQTQTQRTQYDPNKLNAVLVALKKPRALKTRGEVIAEALANVPEERSFTGGFGEEIINPWSMALSSFARSFGNAYKSKKEDERERANEAREDEIKAAQLALEANKSVVTDQVADDYMKINDPNAGGDVSYRFTPDRIKKMKELNDKAGRWATQWGKGVSDMANTEASQAYNEFEGLAKQYVQDQLKKIYGAQMTEQEGERFFKSMGLSPYLDPALRWRLVENALNDVAHKNNLDMQQVVAPNQTPITKKDDGSFTVNGYTIKVKK